MKRAISFLMIISILILALPSCTSKTVTAPTCDELITAYEDAGFSIFHSEDTEDASDWNCYVKVWDEDEYDYVFFYFFDTPEKAKARDDEREYNVLIYLFSVIYGNPQWLHTETYGNIEYEYSNSDLIKPFKELIGS